MTDWTRAFGLTLAVAAMLLRALLPSGWMPASDLSHGTWLEVCDGMAHPTSTPMPGIDDMPAMMGMADMPGMMGMPGLAHPKSDPAHAAHEVCPFASAAQLAASNAVPAFAPPQRLGFVPWRDRRRAQSRPALRLDSSAPRGPPRLV